MLDAVQMLEEQHRVVERLFDDLTEADGAGDKRPILMEIADAITTHAEIEERHFYPAVRTADTERLVTDSLHDHQEVKRLLLHLLDAGPQDADFDTKLEELQGLFESHVETEEDELFPKVRQLMTQDQLEGLAQEMTATAVDLQEDTDPHQMLQEEGREGGI